MSNLKDYAIGTVLTAPSPATSGTSLVLESGEGDRMPSVPFYATASPPGVLPTLDNAEKIKITAISSDTLTIERAQGDTSAKSISDGWKIANAIFATDIPSTTDDLPDSTDKRYVTDAQLAVLADTSGTNTGDQDLSGYVPTTRTVAGHALSANVTISKGDVGLGNVDNTSDATKNSASVALTNKDLTDASNTFPTFNQSTTGNAGTATKLATARNINGVAFDGSADITVADSTKVPTSRTVNGHALSANVTVSKSDVGLGSVTNDAQLKAADLIDEDDMASDSATKVPTQQSVKAYVDNSSIAPPNKYLEAVSLHHIGHSYTKLPYYWGEQYNTEYGLRVRERLKMGDYNWHGRPGTIAASMIGRLLSPTYDSGTGLWTENTKGVVMIENYTNELGMALASDTGFRNLWAASIRGEIATVNSESILAWADKSTTSGTWTKWNASIANKAINGETYYATSSAYVEFPISGGDEAWVATIVSDSSYSIGSLTFICNSVTVGTFAGNGIMTAYEDPVTDATVHTSLQLVKVTGLNAAAGTTGAKTLRIKASASGNCFVSGVIIPSTTPPRVFLAKEPPRGYPAEDNWTNNHTYFDDMIDTIAAEFDNVHVVDLNDGWDGSYMISSFDDNDPPIHPNDAGQSHLADKFAEAINTNITDWDAGVQSL